MQGRHREAQRIADGIDQRDATAIVVVGPAGIGKTTLVRSVLQTRPHAEAISLQGLRWKPYLPLSSALRTEVAGDPEAVAMQVQTLLDGRILFVDDLQWADAGTVAAVEALVGRVPLVVAVRTPSDLPGWDRGATFIDVRPLPTSVCRTLGRRLHPTAPAEEIDRLVALANGNPLLLQHLARHGRATPTLRAAVSSRLDELSPVQRSVVTDLAVLGRPLSADKLGIAVDAMPHGLVTVCSGYVSIGHALLAEAAIESLDARARADTHRRLAGFLPDAEAAEHLLAAGDPDAASAAARRALDTICEPAIRAHLLSVVASATGGPRHHIAAACALVDVGRWSDAARHATAVGSEDLGLAAEAAYHLSRSRWFAGDVVGARTAAEDGLLPIEDTGLPIEARLLVELAHQRVRTDEQTCTTLPIAARALDVAERIGVDVLRARMVHATALAHDGRPGWEDRYHAVIRDAAAAGDGEIECAAAFFLGSHLGFGGRIREATDVLAPMVDRAAELGQLTWRTHLECALLTDRFLGGGEPVDVADRCRTFLDEHPLFRNRIQIVLILTLCLADQGRFREARDVLADATTSLTSPEERSILLTAEAELNWTCGDLAAVAPVAAQAIRLGPGWFGITAGANAAVALTCLELGERVDIEVPTAKTPIFGPFSALVEALRMATRGDAPGALALLDTAALEWDRIGMVRYGARARWAGGVVAARAGHPSARRRLEAARDLATCGGIRPIARRATDELAALDGCELTSREKAILEMIGAGCTSQAISERLAISRSTVETHVKSAMRKLGARTRRQAVARLSGVATP